MSKLLLDEQPLVILPKLAQTIGLNEAIFIQQLHYWLNLSKNIHDGIRWSYNTYDELQEQFPFWSVRTIKNIVKDLKEKKLILVGNFSADKRDKTNWYSIDYVLFEETIRSCKSCTMESADVARSHSADVARCNIVKSLTETSTENKKINKKNKTVFPSNDQELKSYALNKAISSNIKAPIQTYESFKDHHVSKGNQFANWNSAFNTWVTNFYKYKTQNLSEIVCLKAFDNANGIYSSESESITELGTHKQFKITKEVFISKVIGNEIVFAGVHNV